MREPSKIYEDRPWLAAVEQRFAYEEAPTLKRAASLVLEWARSGDPDAQEAVREYVRLGLAFVELIKDGRLPGFPERE